GGGDWSDRRTSPSKVALIDATPASTVARYESAPTISNRWQPGIVRTSTAGSLSAAYTSATGAVNTASPESFMTGPFLGAARAPRQPRSAGAARTAPTARSAAGRSGSPPRP